MTERELYERVWQDPRYRRVSFGEREAADVEVAPGESVLCVGCGTGREGVVLEQRGAVVTLQDLAANCRDPEAEHLPFLRGDAAEVTGRWDLLFSSDFLEHLPADRVGPVLANLATLAPRAYLVADCSRDAFGSILGVGPLHKTVEPPAWWIGMAERYWREVDASGGASGRVTLRCRA